MKEDFFKMGHGLQIISKNKRLLAVQNTCKRLTHALLGRFTFYRFRKGSKVLDCRYMRTAREGTDNGSSSIIHICHIKPCRK